MGLRRHARSPDLRRRRKPDQARRRFQHPGRGGAGRLVREPAHPRRALRQRGRFEVLTPDDLTVDFGDDRVISEQQINLRRFELEIESLRYDGKAVVAGQRRRKAGGGLLRQLASHLLRRPAAGRGAGAPRPRHARIAADFRKTGVPVVGYVDGSRSRDLVHMAASLFKLDAERIHDAWLIDSRLTWGARTPMFVCARGGADRKQLSVLEKFEEYRRGVGVYLKTSATAPPARLEIPLWVLERGFSVR